MARNDPQFRLRLPLDLKAFIEKQAARNSASLNSEIVRCVRERMDRIESSDGASSLQAHCPVAVIRPDVEASEHAQPAK